MPDVFETLLASLQSRAESYGIRVNSEPLGLETPGRFDGQSVTLNLGFDPESRAYYLAHSLGSIAQWSLDTKRSRRVFEELRSAKANKDRDPNRFAKALDEFLAFEQRSSEHAVWLLTDTGNDWAIGPYTTFFRADLESMRRFHERGVAPVWRDFLADWKTRVLAGDQPPPPFRSRPIPPFDPACIETQDVVQEVDGRP